LILVDFEPSLNDLKLHDSCSFHTPEAVESS
jgi:hypothetical protein